MPLITLTTDIGQQDFIVGAVKGQLYSTIDGSVITDISHYLPQENFFHAAYICSNAFKYFPNGTIHFILLNVFENKSSHFVLAEYNQQFIVCPDNGIITMIAGELPKNIITIPVLKANTLLQITEQVIRAIQKLANGNKPDEIGTRGLSIVERYMMKPMIGNDWMEGQILFVDNFENVVINIRKEDFEAERKGRKFRIVFKRNEVITELSANYSSVAESENLAWFNSADYLELAINKGNLAGLFGLERFNERIYQQGIAAQNKWFYQTIRIFFE